MRFKPVPEPPASLAELDAVRKAVPSEPDPDADCCGLVRAELGLDERSQAADWLTFLRALGLVEERSGVYVRTGGDVNRERLAEAFRVYVYGAREVLDVLESEGEPLDTDEAVTRIKMRRIDRQHVERVLEWAVLLGLAERENARHRSNRA